ncbi:MAG: HTH arsR-type domain-containing protein [Nitrospira sp.]|nr:MAG: HTH arsR-type domain-containing protein [Nitrospira sp.]
MKAKKTGDILTSRQCAAVLKAMGDATRLEILESLLVEEKCVNDLVQQLHCSQPHVSHHLRILREAGLVEGHRMGKQVCYRIVQTVQRALANQKGQALDLGCCELRFPESTLLSISRGR